MSEDKVIIYRAVFYILVRHYILLKLGVIKNYNYICGIKL